MEYLIRNNFRMHLISRIWNTNILRALIFAILEKMIMQADLEDRSLLTDHLNNDWVTIIICNYVIEIALIIRQIKQILQINQMLLQYGT